MVRIKGIQKMSLVDYPDKICAVVFLPVCNFRCPFCFNVELVLNPDKLPEISREDFFEFLESRRKWLDGVCVTGGEPTLHKDLPGFLREIKNRGFLVKLDTNGSNPRMLESLLKENLLDYISMDIKASQENYEKAAGAKVNMDAVKKSAELLRSSNVDYEFRTTAVPGLFTRQDALAIGEWLRGSKKYFIQQFRPQQTLDKSFQKTKPFTHKELKEFQKAMKPFFKHCEVREA